MSNMNWDSIYDTASTINSGYGEKKNQDEVEMKPRFYLNSNEDHYIRAVPYLDAEGNPHLFRKVSYHNINTNYVTKAGATETTKKKILCQGQGCKFCENAYILKDTCRDPQWYLSAKTVDYLMLGTVLILDTKKKKFTPVLDEKTGEAKMGAIFLSGISKQPQALDKFLKNDLISLPIEYLKEFEGCETPGDILGKIFSYTDGMVLKIRSSKVDNKWFTELKVLPSYIVALPSSDIDLEESYFNEKLYKQSTLDNALAQFQQQVAIKLGVAPSGGATSQPTPPVGETPWESPSVELSAEDEEAFSAF